MRDPFSVLLVEDEAPKRDHVERFLLGEFDSQNLLISGCKSVSSAIEYFEHGTSDVLLLDMSLPTFDIAERETGGRPQAFGGIEVLRALDYSGHIIPTIVLTGYEAFVDDSGTMNLDELTCDLTEEFPDFIDRVIHYSASHQRWKIDLKDAIKAIFKRRVL